MASDSSNALAKFPSEKFDNQVLVSVAGDPKAKVVTITINNASKMNTMNAAVIGGVTAALELASDDTSVAVVVFTGAGDRAFCAGGNLQGGGASQGFRGGGELATATGAIRNLRNSMASAVLLRSSHFVSIAAVNGACAGAGLSWACACDIRVASATALFRAGFVTAGLSGDFGGTWTVSRVKPSVVSAQDKSKLTETPPLSPSPFLACPRPRALAALLRLFLPLAHPLCVVAPYRWLGQG